MTAYTKLAYYIASENLAYGLTGECKKTTFSSRSVLKEMVERNLMGEHYMKVEEDGEPITYQLSIDVYITRKNGKPEVSKQL